ncbi:MAG: hypothetical protein QOJ65_1158 [Fimbriimonadaceae bacterium]|jgi:AcrR family transcriptional regulator|nr:hypothetical protein [Fimbriimonadaceae bacterium]
MSAASQTPASSGKQRVLDAAHDLFAEGSYVEIGVALILEKAGVQAPTLYHHYGDKEGLFVVWAEQAFRNIENEVARHSRPGVSAKEGLCTYAWALLSSANFDLQQVLRDAPRL